MDNEMAARAVNAEPWEPLLGFASPAETEPKVCLDCTAEGSRRRAVAG